MDLQPVKALRTKRPPLGKQEDAPREVTAQVVEVRRARVSPSTEVHVVGKPKDPIPHVLSDGELIEGIHAQAIHFHRLLAATGHLALQRHLGQGAAFGKVLDGLGSLRRWWRDVQFLIALVVEDGDDNVQNGLVDLPRAVPQLIEGVHDGIEVTAGASLQQ